MDSALHRPETAWQNLLLQLQRERPQAEFHAWLRAAHLLSFQDGVLTFELDDPYARAWLASRLSGILARELSGRLNRTVAVRFAPPSSSGIVLPLEGEKPSSPVQAWTSIQARLVESLEPEAAALAASLRFLAYYDGQLILSLPELSTRERAAKTLAGRITTLLEDHLPGQKLAVQFVVAPDQESRLDPVPPPGTIPEPAPRDKRKARSPQEAEILLKPIRTSLRDIITRPKSVVVVSAYLLRWLPYLGVDLGWFVLAMRQAFFRAHGAKVSRDNCGQTFTVSRRGIARWSSLGDKKVWRCLKQLEKKDQAGNYLAWFMQAARQGPGRPKLYTFRADMPLTPGDVEALASWLSEHGIQNDPLAALKAALEAQPHEILPYPPPPPAEHHARLAPDPRTVQEVVLEASGLARTASAYLPLKQLADELQLHLQSPSDNLLITHYFLLEWLGKLGRVAGWIVTILRDRGFIDHTQGIRRDHVRLTDGYTELAQLLGASERQIESWLPPLEAMIRRTSEPDEVTEPSAWDKRQAKRGLVSHFLDKEGQVDWSGNGNTTYDFKVKLEDPLTPRHRQIYTKLESLLHESLISADQAPLEQIAMELERALVREGHSFSKDRYANHTGSPSSDARTTQPEQDMPREPHNSRYANHTGTAPDDARITHLKALLIKYLNPKALEEIKQLLQQHLETWQPVEAGRQEGGGENDDLIWDWDKLLGYTGAGEEIRKEIDRSPQLQLQFLGQVLYGYQHRADGVGNGIQAPFKFAASRRYDCPPPEYMTLAALAPNKMLALIQDELREGASRTLPDSAYRVVQALRENDFALVLRDAVCRGSGGGWP